MTGFGGWKWEVRKREESRPFARSAEGLGRKDDRVKWSCPAGTGRLNPEVGACDGLTVAKVCEERRQNFEGKDRKRD